MTRGGLFQVVFELCLRRGAGSNAISAFPACRESARIHRGSRRILPARVWKGSGRLGQAIQCDEQRGLQVSLNSIVPTGCGGLSPVQGTYRVSCFVRIFTRGSRQRLTARGIMNFVLWRRCRCHQISFPNQGFSPYGVLVIWNRYEAAGVFFRARRIEPCPLLLLAGELR